MSMRSARSKRSIGQASLPMRRGRAGTMTHDYKRTGTTTLFAALNALDGRVMPMHGPPPSTGVPTDVDREFPGDREMHLIVDNYSTHKHENVNQWLAKHPRFHLHFTPTSSSWLNPSNAGFGN